MTAFGVVAMALAVAWLGLVALGMALDSAGPWKGDR